MGARGDVMQRSGRVRAESGVVVELTWRWLGDEALKGKQPRINSVLAPTPKTVIGDAPGTVEVS
jgi:hypothetical protein